ncbi:ABC transporter ATP-binding protein [Candidatus Gracilibacteria bacterium]|nr:ABC transporter ATP-binding protein [Candidatus Gracilibacteria bacterium]
MKKFKKSTHKNVRNTAEQPVVIEVKNLSKTFIVPTEKRNTLKDTLFNLHRRNPKRIFKALGDISFSVKKGEFFGIIGRNGSGKSTLLKILSKIYKADKGSMIKIDGLISPFLELGVGFNPEMTARENVYLNASILGLPKEEIDNKFVSIIAFAELEDFVDQKLKFFSSGMQVRLAFAVAIQADADIILLDEVLAVGDASFQQKCFDTFRQFKKQGKTIIFVSHDLGSVRQFCNRVMYIKDSKLQMIGDPNEVVDYYLYKDNDEEKAIPTLTSDTLKQKPIVIQRVEFIDKFGHKNKTFLSGDQFLIRVHYQKNVPALDDVVLGIAIYSDTDVHIYGTNTSLRRKKLELKGEGTIDLVCDNLPLLQGKFLVTLAFHHVDGTVYDWQDKQFTFYVQKNNSDDGLVAFNFKF